MQHSIKGKSHGGDWYDFCKEHGYRPLDFSISLNPLGISEKVRDALHKHVDMPASYPDIHNKDLLKAVCAYENAAGIYSSSHEISSEGSTDVVRTSVDANQVVFGNGAAELIFRICEVIKPKKSLIVSPGFSEYEAALTSKECSITRCTLSEDNNFSLKADFLNSITNDLDIIFLCNPNSPTGSLIDKKLLDRIASRADLCGVTLVVDECFIDLCTRPADSLVVNIKNYQNLIILKALTKSHALAGLRLGYALCSSQETADKLRQHSRDWPLSSFAQVAGAAALEDCEYLQISREIISRERVRLEVELTNLGFTVFPSSANFILFKESLGESASARQGTRTNLSTLLRNKGILIRDCSNFEGLGVGYFRVAVKTEEENEQLIRAFREIKKEDGASSQ